jgi:hypothetical protein
MVLLNMVTLAALGFCLLVTGPLAALGFQLAVSKNVPWPKVWFWLCLAIAHFISLALMYLSFGWGHAFPGAGWIALGMLPWMAIVTLVLLLLLAQRRWPQSDSLQRLWWATGTLTIPLLQVMANASFHPIGVPFFQKLQSVLYPLVKSLLREQIWWNLR